MQAVAATVSETAEPGQSGDPFDAQGMAPLYRKRLDPSLGAVAKGCGPAREYLDDGWKGRAVTEVNSLGVDLYVLRDAAQHAGPATTNRYSRNRSAGATQIAQVRHKK